jgi:hypothetical protein
VNVRELFDLFLKKVRFLKIFTVASCLIMPQTYASGIRSKLEVFDL